jgi:vancomycin resistance protein YoaR
MDSEQDRDQKEISDSPDAPALEVTVQADETENFTEPIKAVDPDEVETIFFEQPSLGYDPVEKIDKIIDETAGHYLTEIINNLEQIPRPITLGKRIAKAAMFTALSIATLTGVVAISYSISHLPLRSHFLGVDTSNALPQRAYEDIQNKINPILANPINIKTKSSTVQFSPERLGIKLDLVETLNQAPKNPFSSIYSLLVPIGIEPVFEIDENKFAIALNSIAIEQELEPQVAGIEIADGEVITYRQINGQSINWQKTINEIQRNWLRNDQPLPLVFDEIEPAITDADVNLLAQTAESMLSKPVKIRFANQTKAFERRDIGDALSIQVSDGKLALELNSIILWNKLGGKFLGINQPVKNAQLQIVDDKPVIVPANTATKITSSEFKELFSEQLKNTGDRLIDLTTYEVNPSVSTKDIQALGIVEKVSEYRQWFPPAQYRTLNVGTAARFIDGKILKPGEIYSMNDTIKERTEENGYVPGIFISNGRFEEGYGGGVSIITTALWTAAFFAGLEPIEQRAHSIYIPRYQEGIEATVQWGSLDLKFRNNLDHAIMFKTKVDADGVTITLYGTKKFDQVIAKKTNRYNVKEFKTLYSEAKSCIPQEGQPGFGVTVTRELIKAGAVVQTDEFKTNYRVGNELICGPNPKKKKTEEPVVEGELITAAE